MPHELYNKLHAGLTADGEVEDILLAYFHGAMQGGLNEVVYPGVDANFAVRLIYEGDALSDIQPGPALTSQDIEALAAQIDQELLADSGSTVGQVILFANVPVNGFFSYRNMYQIVPVPVDAPRPGFLAGPHPFVLRFRFNNSSNWTIRAARRTNISRELELFLASVTMADIHGIGPNVRHRWMVIPDEEPANWQIRLLQEMYFHNGVAAELPDFPADDDVEPLSLVNATAYFGRRGISVDQGFDLPENITLLSDIFFGLPRDLRVRFLRASFWFQHALRVHGNSRSACFTALISAVEALMGDAEPSSVCPHCGRLLGKGPTARFIDFTESLAGGDEPSRPERRKLYAIRSALSHGGTLLRSDEIPWRMGMNAAGIKEWEDLNSAWRLVRIVLVNWLLTRQSGPQQLSSGEGGP